MWTFCHYLWSGLKGQNWWHGAFTVGDIDQNLKFLHAFWLQKGPIWDWTPISGGLKLTTASKFQVKTFWTFFSYSKSVHRDQNLWFWVSRSRWCWSKPNISSRVLVTTYKRATIWDWSSNFGWLKTNYSLQISSQNLLDPLQLSQEHS